MGWKQSQRAWRWMQTVQSGGKKARNGVGICVRNHQDKVLEVCRTSDRVMAVKIVLADNAWTIVNAYAPQVGCDEDTIIIIMAGMAVFTWMATSQRKGADGLYLAVITASPRKDNVLNKFRILKEMQVQMRKPYQSPGQDEKLILLYCPGRGLNSRPTAHRSFKHGQGVPRP